MALSRRSVGTKKRHTGFGGAAPGVRWSSPLCTKPSPLPTLSGPMRAQKSRASSGHPKLELSFLLHKMREALSPVPGTPQILDSGTKKITYRNLDGVLEPE